ncbi:MAG: Rpn family recombination-promoting nuclease/putative transposase [Lachnospiraceae bacterium]|nr:Rpn family recombination-promoting nuclease/putative transposase [Lachnospiraceae bacterium]
MDNFIMKPKIDFAFKEIMEDVKARTGFLASILQIDPTDIKETRIQNSNLRKLHENDKLGILDVRILMNNNTQIDTEIQLSELKIWSDRALFYISKMYTDQIGKGQHYDVLKKCVSISILDFILFENEPEFYSRFHILEDTRHFLYTDKMEFHVIELPKLPDSLRDDSGRIELWAKFINAEKKEEFDMIAEKDPYIQSAYEHLQVISQDEQKRLEYEARQKAILDYNQSIFEAEQRGEKRGEQRGEQRGEKRGEQSKTISIAEKMLEAGYDPAEILAITGISEEQLVSLQAARQKNMTKARL